MRVPKEYLENIKNETITKPMLLDCLYSLNKRAKNIRDSINKEFDQKKLKELNNIKDDLYCKKQFILIFFEPTAIHRVNRNDKEYEEFIFYDLGKHSFHTPITSDSFYVIQLRKQVKTIYLRKLKTYGQDPKKLLPIDIIDQIIEILKKNKISIKVQ